jgi:hypothetical protein
MLFSQTQPQPSQRAHFMRKQSLISLRLAPTPMRVFPIGIELANVVAVQRAHDGDPGEHRKGVPTHGSCPSLFFWAEWGAPGFAESMKQAREWTAQPL